MQINEIASSSPDKDRLAAIGQFLLGRAEDTGAKKSISINSFIKIAQDLGMSISSSQLKTLSTEEPLSNIIADVRGDDESGEVIFKGADISTDDNTMSVDQARKTVDQMAKRAVDI